MPDNQSASQQSASSHEELVRVTQKLYEQNLELAIRNRTFGVLRKIYEIINTSLGVKETAQKIIDAVVSELKFQNGFIALIQKKSNILKSIAVSLSSTVRREELFPYTNLFENLSLSLYDRENYCISSILENRRRMTNSVYDILAPLANEKKALEIQKNLSIQTCIIYPIVFSGEVLGVLMLGLDKHLGFLSRAEREILKEVIELIGIAIERSQIYEDLKVANKRLKEVDKLKDEFVSVASHELRTPMTTIKSYLWLALAGRGGQLTEKQKFYLTRAYKSTDRLINLVNDMLNVSRIESGRMTMYMEKCNIQDIAEDIIAEVLPRANELGIELKINTVDKLPFVFADSDKIKEVLINLIGNCLKFTQRGGCIVISFKIKHNYIEIHVSDTGIGIDKTAIPKLFQKFGLIKESYVTNEAISQGTGLGLYICKSIVELHGGSISVFSEGRNKGTTIIFTLKVVNESLKNQLATHKEKTNAIGMIHSGL